MLRKAQERVVEQKLDNVEALAVMDAKHLGLPDASFDVVVAQYVITAVPDPEATLHEFARVLKPGGEIVLVNHIGAETGLRRAFEQWFAPVARRLGWRPEFPWGRLASWAENTNGMRLIERRPMPPLGHFSLIRFAKGDAAAVARVAGIMGAKRTPELIPLCHPIELSAVDVDLRPAGHGIAITATVSTTGPTGVEMEAMTAVATTALTIYDMVKGVERGVTIEWVRLRSKDGGRTGRWEREVVE